MDFIGLVETPCRRFPFALNCSNVMSSSAVGGIQCFGDCHRIVHKAVSLKREKPRYRDSVKLKDKLDDTLTKRTETRQSQGGAFGSGE